MSDYRAKAEKNIKNIAQIGEIDDVGNKVYQLDRLEAEKAALIANVGFALVEAIRDSGNITNNVNVSPAHVPSPVVQNFIYPKEGLLTKVSGKIRAWMRYHRFTKATR